MWQAADPESPSRLGEASSAVLVSAFHTPVDEERLAQVFLTHFSVHKCGRLKNR